jgi:hypothetical protein
MEIKIYPIILFFLGVPKLPRFFLKEPSKGA